MRKVSQTTLAFINKNIKTNEQASSFPLRSPAKIKTTLANVSSLKVTSQPLTSASANLTTLKSAKNLDY